MRRVVLLFLLPSCAGTYHFVDTPVEAMHLAKQSAEEECAVGGRALIETYPVLWFQVGHAECLDEQR